MPLVIGSVLPFFSYLNKIRYVSRTSDEIRAVYIQSYARIKDTLYNRPWQDVAILPLRIFTSADEQILPLYHRLWTKSLSLALFVHETSFQFCCIGNSISYHPRLTSHEISLQKSIFEFAMTAELKKWRRIFFTALASIWSNIITNSNEKKTCLLLCLLCIFKFQTLARQNFWIFYFTSRLTLYECVVNVYIQR